MQPNVMQDVLGCVQEFVYIPLCAGLKDDYVSVAAVIVIQVQSAQMQMYVETHVCANTSMFSLQSNTKCNENCFSGFAFATTRICMGIYVTCRTLYKIEYQNVLCTPFS